MDSPEKTTLHLGHALRDYTYGLQQDVKLEIYRYFKEYIQK